MVGDDLTDEHAFAAALALGGTAVLVGRQRDSLAPWRLPDVAAVRRWLMGDA
jgi:trehalose 6-phosphate phosphatase